MSYRRTTSTVCLVAVVVALVAACSSSGSSGAGSDDPGSTTAAPAITTPLERAKTYGERGPYSVGYTETKLGDGRQVVVWYPSTAQAVKGHDREQIDVASLLSPELQAKIPAEDRVKYPADAFLDAEPRPEKGGYPVVVFSHGFAGFPEQSVTLTTHLASWGYVVAAPNHVERSLDGLLGTAAENVTKSTDPEVLSATLDLVEAQSAKSGSLLHGTVDDDKAAVAGHSAGAGAAYRVAGIDPRFKTWISYSVGLGNDGTDTAPPKVPDKPGMVMLGTGDGIIPPAASEAVYAGMQSPKYLVSVTGAGHLVFSDLCLIGADKGGIVNIAKTLELPIPDELLKLGSDGCGDGYPPTDEAFPAIDSASVSFLRWVFQTDAAPDALTTEALAPLGTPVSVEHD
ncbi:MAG TPA: dienelactone hydrolase family protein [Acidimicrobiales bacterium]|nr:dienelactone hydrolase family protein [Acidimicrobiales bacterium]